MYLHVYVCTLIGRTQVLGEDVEELRRRMVLLKTICDSDVLAHAALLGDESVIKEYLDEYPNDVSAHSQKCRMIHYSTSTYTVLSKLKCLTVCSRLAFLWLLDEILGN